jgi:hypothetical protein
MPLGATLTLFFGFGVVFFFKARDEAENKMRAWKENENYRGKKSFEVSLSLFLSLSSLPLRLHPRADGRDRDQERSNLDSLGLHVDTVEEMRLVLELFSARDEEEKVTVKGENEKEKKIKNLFSHFFSLTPEAESK